MGEMGAVGWWKGCEVMGVMWVEVKQMENRVV